MITMGVIIGITLLAGGGFVWRELLRAPLGVQDENGFHAIEETRDRPIRQVASEAASEGSAQTA